MDNKDKEPTGKAKGGVARAKSLSPQERSDQAKNGAIARWGYKATHKGNFKDEFGIDAECYVLNDSGKTVVVSGAGLARLLGLGDHMVHVTRLLNAQYMADFVGTKLREKIENPLKFQWKPAGSVLGSFTDANGYDFTAVGDLAIAIINAHQKNALPKTRVHTAELAQKLVNASMKAGLKGLAYAIAGYRPEVQEVIDSFKAFVREEARQYEKEFPDELYEAWYRIYQLNKPDRGRPFLFSKLTNEQIYMPLARSQGVILDLAKKNKDESGKSGLKIHQFLSEVGVKALKQQIGKVLAVSELFEERDKYESALAKVNK
ncbi:P63C domain-containing protein [Mixta mediterraneensis]|uniref:P63C domain-containing protein n=1 Tax=Mixta mediterraneensis TaxID=2758443 RepID=UPI00187695FC|nr:P63C domain-containing protein [Mixta mediterraneensis]MBE5254552.1 hypothetical protein [Mixta mediterraneensis]